MGYIKDLLSQLVKGCPDYKFVLAGGTGHFVSLS